MRAQARDLAASEAGHQPVAPRPGHRSPPQTRISQIVRGKRAITTDAALRLSKALGVDDRFWINIQTDYDLEVERDLHADDLAKVTALVPS